MPSLTVDNPVPLPSQPENIGIPPPKMRKEFDHKLQDYIMVPDIPPKFINMKVISTNSKKQKVHHGYPLGKHPPTEDSKWGDIKALKARRAKNKMARASRQKQRKAR